MAHEIPMNCKKSGIIITPIKIFRVNDSTIIAIYKGKLSQYDILIKYRQKLPGEKWSRIRTPKHIHWTVDILIKMQGYESLTKEFIDFFITLWKDTTPITSEEGRASIDPAALLNLSQREIIHFQDLSKKGQYSIKFLILLAKLLMIQEKTNRQDAYMFKELLDALRSGRDLFDILSISSHRSIKRRA